MRGEPRQRHLTTGTDRDSGSPDEESGTCFEVKNVIDTTRLAMLIPTLKVELRPSVGAGRVENLGYVSAAPLAEPSYKQLGY